MRAVVLVGVIAACAPVVDSPVTQQRAIDRGDAHALAVQLSKLPGVLAADAVVQRPVTDVLTGETTHAAATIALVVDARANRDELATLGRVYARMLAPEAGDPEIAVLVGGGRPDLAQLGPFLVAAGDRRALVAMLGVTLALLAAAAGYVAWRERPGS